MAAILPSPPPLPSASLHIYESKTTDDSYNNCAGAHELGWVAAHLLEDDAPQKFEKLASQFQIKDLLELRDVFPQFFSNQTLSQGQDDS
jgi:hypothetical protein